MGGKTRRTARSNMTLAQLLPVEAFPVLLVFARVGAALMLLPGFGDLYVPQRWRLLLAVALSLLVASVVGPSLPRLPTSPATLLALLFGEIVAGLFLGTVARLLLAALETAGQIVSLQLGLSAATVFNPAAAQQGAVTGAFLMMLGTLLVFLTDAHYLMIRAVVDSYALFTPGTTPAFGDFADAMLSSLNLLHSALTTGKFPHLPSVDRPMNGKCMAEVPAESGEKTGCSGSPGLARGQIASTVVITSPPSSTATCPIVSPYATGPLIEDGMSNLSLTSGICLLGNTTAISLSETGWIVPPDWT